MAQSSASTGLRFAPSEIGLYNMQLNLEHIQHNHIKRGLNSLSILDAWTFLNRLNICVFDEASSSLTRAFVAR
jgi:hypothetical protein